ncbi:major facilitator superfamily transporter [Aspergillus japonicus CBS 114.51]|uniref:Major facilitator superfamily transporter n=1 Tax=Aspergillus japonicus CBS 114.51 TaxID=1448312 RepID=A0A8T8XC10_ASPJA|nr:major facilitator superfamily transporter [Aspergillus japonicus CBS 114.51]RAH85568.1 major facilitator superfamily transporter [Aspergillus japonicus CBS 114.51]
MSLPHKTDISKVEAQPNRTSTASIHEGKVSDVAADIVHAAEDEFTQEQYNKLRKKIDWIILPLMWVISGTQYADKASIATQATFGMRADTHLAGQQYSWLTSIFYIAFLVSEAPGNYILQRSGLGITVAISMFCWAQGIIVLCIAFAKNFAGLAVLRFLEGVTECTTYPALLIITASWYTKEEHAMRSVVWGSANAGMDVLTSLINYGIGREAEARPTGLAPWKGISIFLGSLTIALSILVYFTFGTPREVRWLTDDEKRMASARIVASQTGSDAQKRDIDWRQVKITFQDPQTYFFFILVMVNSIPNGGTTAFGNLVYVSFGFTNLETLVEGKIPQQILSILWFLVAGYITLKKSDLRFYIMIFSVIPAFTGMLALALLPHNAGQLWVRWGMYFMTIIGNVAGPLIWTLLPSNVAGRTKKSVTGTVLFIAYCAGNCIGAQVFRDKDAPRYIPAIVVCSVMYALEIVLMGAWRSYYIWQNTRRDRLVAEMGLTKEQSLHLGRLNAEEDMTDWENVHFRYSV